ncbi:MAG: cellulose biosynthesis protein BcsS [Hyphomicrobiaceae bacterium]|nr:cellulose biosynthesis protein BcsS [Hyphomicrobiaceae bacterium]
MCITCIAVFAVLQSLALAPFQAARAAEQDRPTAPTWIETWSGADIAGGAWSLYGGATVAPFASLERNGLRLRAAGGYGQYRYDGRPTGSTNPALHRYAAQVSSAEALIGWQTQLGPLTAKAFVGIASLTHEVDPGITSALAVVGEDYGVKGALELWLNLGSSAWVSLDASWTAAHETYGSRLRLGHRVTPALSAGLEAALNGHAVDTDSTNLLPHERPKPAGRAGLFARYEWSGGEVSLSAGLAGNTFEVADDLALDNGYATVNWLTHY